MTFILTAIMLPDSKALLALCDSCPLNPGSSQSSRCLSSGDRERADDTWIDPPFRAGGGKKTAEKARQGRQLHPYKDTLFPTLETLAQCRATVTGRVERAISHPGGDGGRGGTARLSFQAPSVMR